MTSTPPDHMLENRLEAMFRKRVQMALGGMVIKLAPIDRGTPDRLVLLPKGRMYLVELKTDVGRLSEAQRHWHERAGALGIRVFTLYGPTQVLRWIKDRADEAAPPERPARCGYKGRIKTCQGEREVMCTRQERHAEGEHRWRGKLI